MADGESAKTPTTSKPRMKEERSMARVFEALLQSSEADPRGAGRFLVTYDFTHVIEEPADVHPPHALPALARHLLGPEDVPGEPEYDYSSEAESFDYEYAAPRGLGAAPYEGECAAVSYEGELALPLYPDEDVASEPVGEALAERSGPSLLERGGSALLERGGSALLERGGSALLPLCLEPAESQDQMLLQPSSVAFHHPLPPELREEFGRLRSALMLAAESQRLQVVIVCGVAPGDGASFVARNLSLLLAEFNKLNVARFEVTAAEASSTIINGSASDSYQLTLRRTEVPNLREIAGAHGNVALQDLLRLCDLPAMMEKLRSRFDFVLIDAPAVTAHPEVALLAGQADAVVLVAQQDETKCAGLEAARATLASARAQVLGVVLNRRREHLPRAFASIA
jgi:Mrp family chromosome partitioning ATPase